LISWGIVLWWWPRWFVSTMGGLRSRATRRYFWWSKWIHHWGLFILNCRRLMESGWWGVNRCHETWVYWFVLSFWGHFWGGTSNRDRRRDHRQNQLYWPWFVQLRWFHRRCEWGTTIEGKHRGHWRNRLLQWENLQWQWRGECLQVVSLALNKLWMWW